MAKTNSKKSTKNAATKKSKQDNLQNQIDELTSQVEKEKDQFLRLFAEFENYKKRTSKERLELYKTASQEVVTALLAVVDDFERALAEMKIVSDVRNGRRHIQPVQYAEDKHVSAPKEGDDGGGAVDWKVLDLLL